jgi:RNA polymerase sigma factor (sigma-70 family)
MLGVYLGQCAPYSSFLDTVSLNEPVPGAGDDGSEVIVELVETLACPFPSPEEEFLEQDALNKIGAFVDALPSNLKVVAKLHYWEGVTQVDIAGELGISQSAVSQRLSKVIALGRDFFGLTVN